MCHLPVSYLGWILSSPPMHPRREFRSRRRRRGRSKRSSSMFPPFVFERTDVCCDEQDIHLNLIILITETNTDDKPANPNDNENSTQSAYNSTAQFLQHFLQKLTHRITTDPSDDNLLSHVATVVLQTKLRAILPSLDAISFIADGIQSITSKTLLDTVCSSHRRR